MRASSLWWRSFAGTFAATLVAVSCHGGGTAPVDGGATGGATSASSTSGPSGTGGAGGAPIDAGGGGDASPDAGCSGDAAADGGADASTGCEGLEGGVSYGSDVALIFLANCNGELCHLTPSPASLVGHATQECCDHRPDVAPGDADHSYLMNKLTGEGICSGGRMPFGKPALADADILTIRRWICEGAPSN